MRKINFSHAPIVGGANYCGNKKLMLQCAIAYLSSTTESVENCIRSAI